MEACAACGGVGYGHRESGIGYVDDGVPCSCNPDGVPKEPGSFAPKPERTVTMAWADAPGHSGPDDRPLSPTEAGFSPAQVEAQRRIDAAKEARMTSTEIGGES